jgi:phage terminase large subunit GpA-like protein
MSTLRSTAMPPMKLPSMSERAIERHFARGIKSFAVPSPINLDEWSREHFYLSAESSYVEQRWIPWWFQSAIMACISNDDIREIIWRKSARVGYTKMILAAIGYFAEHKRRNQALWQPTDDDRDEFVKAELEPMLRDVAAMQNVFPAFLRRDKDNTLQSKKFMGSLLHLKGGKAAKNYRRISIDTGYLDEYDAFDANIEREGDPGTLAGKRVEGATFPKLVIGSTPKLNGFSNIQKREQAADLLMTPHFPCPECGEFHPLVWGGKDEPSGIKWRDDDPTTVRHLCPHCGALIDQAQYLAAANAETGRYQAADGTTCDRRGVFRDADGNVIRPPDRVAFHTWSAYSPNVSWIDIVRDWLTANREASEGKKDKLQAFVNTTLGEYWAEDHEQADDDELRQRAEPFPLGRAPMGCLLLLASIDTQPNRLEIAIWGYGRGGEMWTVDHRVLFGNPNEDDVWHEAEEYLFETQIDHASGQKMSVLGVAVDSGGHNTHAVYAWAAKHSRRKVFAIKGRSGRERTIKDGASKVDIDWRGRVRKNGLVLWHVGTAHAKDLLHGRLQIQRPGPGYVHFSRELSDEWFRQFAGEARTTRKTTRGDESAWTPTRKRVEAWDCAVYAVWLEAYFELGKRGPKFWDEIEAVVQPAVSDLFAHVAVPQVQLPIAPPAVLAAKPARQPSRRIRGSLA